MNRRLGLPAINIYKDDAGKIKGFATLSYEEPICAKAAVEHFDGVLDFSCFLNVSKVGSLRRLGLFLEDVSPSSVDAEIFLWIIVTWMNEKLH